MSEVDQFHILLFLGAGLIVWCAFFLVGRSIP
jgi:hypothetical protein